MGSGAKARWVSVLLATLWAATCAAPGAALDEATHRVSGLPPKELLGQLLRVELDAGNSFQVSELHLRHEAIRLTLRHGTLVFLAPVDGRVTGAVFEGAGEILVLPPDLPERQQMAKFTGSPLLAETFDGLYLRFSEDTYAELREQVRAGRGEPRHAPELLERWRGRMEELNRAHALRLLLNLLTEKPAGYFFASVGGERLGRFDVVADERRAERLLVGQVRAAGTETFYDVWTSFSPGEPAPTASVPERALSYRISAVITAQHELEATCEVELEPAGAHQQVLLFELSRRLVVEEIVELSGEQTRPLDFFQNATMTAEEALHRGTDVVAVVLPAAMQPGAGEPRRKLRFRYRGDIITPLGNGVFYVGARQNWYPHAGGHAPAQFELRFRYPRGLELVATGAQREEREDGEWKESLWVSEGPLPIAGFNLGEYEDFSVGRVTLAGPGLRVDVYCNRELEPMLLARVQRSTPAPRPRRPRASRLDDALPPAPALLAPPSEQAERMATDVLRALDVYSALFGPFPYRELKVTQIPGRFGQGYPGLLYVSTLSFLEPGDLTRLGIRERAQEHFLEIVPAHETAHQWWGNWVQLPRYRDQWLAESLAAYSSLLYLERVKGWERRQRWLERYRDDVLSADAQGAGADATGPLALGARLDSSRSPNGYSNLVYTKGPWVIHMLRELFRDPDSLSDEVFLGVLRGLAEKREGPLTTDEFVRRLEAALPAHADVEGTGKLDWFFGQWVYNTGIPHYKLRWEARAEGAAWRVEGSIEQSEVSEVFTMPLAIWARRGREWSKLGTVVATGTKVEFRFPLDWKPDEVRLDVHGSVLAVYE